MKVNKLHLTKLFIFLNSIYFAKASALYLGSNELEEEEASGMETNLTSLYSSWAPTLTYEEIAIAMEEKFKSLSKNFNKLELKMDSIISENVNKLEDSLRNMMEQIVEDKITKTEQKFEEKLKPLTSVGKPSYNVHELKCSNNRLPTSCHDLNECNSNVYSIMVPEFSNKSFPAVCDLKTLDGGWTIIQLRQDGSENFYRNWTDYVEGFGNMNGEFFIGLEKLYALTSLGEPQELYIILEDFEGERRYARYGEFKVDSKSTDYELSVDKYSGDAGDCFTQHSGHKFSTKDRDNDVSDRNCAERWKGAWWYASCFYSNLNGLYLAGKIPKTKRGISWCKFRNYEYSLKFVQMMIRPKSN